MEQAMAQEVEQGVFGLPVDRKAAFSNHKKVYKKRIEKRQRKLLKKVEFIRPFLKDGEQIMLVTTGCSPISFMEQLVTGWIVFYIKRAIFIFTNKRIFHVPTKANYDYRNSVAQILYADCESIRLKGRALMIKYKNGRKERFYYIAGKERKKLKVLFQTFKPSGEPSRAGERTHLCPSCSAELVKDSYACPSCRLEFKEKAEAKKVSLFFPGGGYFYTRHPVLGFLDAAGEIILMAAVGVGIYNMANGVAGGMADLIVFGTALVIEKATSMYHASHFVREYITREKEFKPRLIPQRA